jgi:hypothetical protein
MGNTYERFLDIVGATRREGSVVRQVEEPEPPKPDPEADLKAALAGWTSDERATKVFVPWLEGEMEKAILRAQLRLFNAEVAKDLGFEAGLRFVRDRLIKWANRGQA